MPATPLPGFRLIKSHAGFNPDYNRVVYLVRDPRDVMASYHAFAHQLGWYGGSLEEMVDDPQFGISAWCDHVSGWLDRIPASRSFALLKYEDLLADTQQELKQLYRLLGFDLADELVATAVERSSVERMREEEALANARHPALGKMEFVRKGRTGGARSPLPEPVKARIEEIAGPLMRRLGYL
jgi:hypothetical protein